MNTAAQQSFMQASKVDPCPIVTVWGVCLRPRDLFHWLGQRTPKVPPSLTDRLSYNKMWMRYNPYLLSVYRKNIYAEPHIIVYSPTWDFKSFLSYYSDMSIGIS